MTSRWMYAIWRGQRAKVLYNLKEDPEQKRNVSSQNPEVVTRLHKHVTRYLKRQGLDELVDEYV